MIDLKPIPQIPPLARDMDLAANRLPSTNALDGRAFGLVYEDGSELSIELDNGVARFAGLDGEGEPFEGACSYDAVEMRPGIFFLDWASADPVRSFTHVVDFNRGRALSIWIVVSGEGDAATMRKLLRPARIAGSEQAYEPIAETRDLFGKRLVCKYSDEAALEHIYVNSKVIVWQWMISPDVLKHEVGVESGTLWKIEENLYLLASRGEAPIGLILFMDLDRWRNVGRLFGYGSFGVVDRRCGAEIFPLGEFRYPPAFAPA